MTWTKLIDSSLERLHRGFLLKFPAKYPFEPEVIMMLCGYPDDGNRLAAAGLITISGYCAGINCHVVFPQEEIDNGISREFLISNWNKWVYEGNVRDVWIRPPLEANEL